MYKCSTKARFILLPSLLLYSMYCIARGDDIKFANVTSAVEISNKSSTYDGRISIMNISNSEELYYWNTMSLNIGSYDTTATVYDDEMNTYIVYGDIVNNTKKPTLGSCSYSGSNHYNYIVCYTWWVINYDDRYWYRVFCDVFYSYMFAENYQYYWIKQIPMQSLPFNPNYMGAMDIISISCFHDGFVIIIYGSDNKYYYGTIDAKGQIIIPSSPLTGYVPNAKSRTFCTSYNINYNKNMFLLSYDYYTHSNSQGYRAYSYGILVKYNSIRDVIATNISFYASPLYESTDTYDSYWINIEENHDDDQCCFLSLYRARNNSINNNKMVLYITLIDIDGNIQQVLEVDNYSNLGLYTRAYIFEYKFENKRNDDTKYFGIAFENIELNGIIIKSYFIKYNKIQKFIIKSFQNTLNITKISSDLRIKYWTIATNSNATTTEMFVSWTEDEQYSSGKPISYGKIWTVSLNN